MSSPAMSSYQLPGRRDATAPPAVRVENSLSTAFLISGFMVLTILLSLAVGHVGAIASCVMLALAVIYCAATNSTLTIPLFLGYAALEGLYKYMTGFSQVVYVVKPILEFAILGSLLQANRLRGLRLSIPPLATLIAMFGGWACVEVFHPLGSGLAGGFGQLIIWYLAPMSLLWTVYNSIRSVRQIETICYTLVAISVVVSLFAAFQYQMGQSWTMSHLPGYAIINQGEWTITNARGSLIGVSWRPASTTAIGGGGSLWAMWGSTIATGLLLSRRISVPWKYLLLASISINAYGIILSGSRLFLIVAMLQGVLLFAILARSPRELARNLALMMIVAGMIWIGFTTAQSASGGIITSRYSETLSDPLAKYNHDRGGLDGRSDMMLTMLAQYPFGVGYQRGTDGGNAHDRVSTGYGVNRDDAFNSVSGDMGWPGLLFAIAIFLAIALRGWSSFLALASAHLRLLGGVFLAVMMGYLVCFFGGPALNGADMLWLLLAMLLVMPRVQQLEKRRLGVQIIPERTV